jgi:predicted HicB family RNase H-like nuclease
MLLRGITMSQLYVRLEEDLHSKLRVIAALKNESLNATMIAAAATYVEAWESKNGALPKPPQAK